MLNRTDPRQGDVRVRRRMAGQVRPSGPGSRTGRPLFRIGDAARFIKGLPLAEQLARPVACGERGVECEPPMMAPSRWGSLT
jgi:hypothetical protein